MQVLIYLLEVDPSLKITYNRPPMDIKKLALEHMKMHALLGNHPQLLAFATESLPLNWTPAELAKIWDYILRASFELVKMDLAEQANATLLELAKKSDDPEVQFQCLYGHSQYLLRIGDLEAANEKTSVLVEFAMGLADKTYLGKALYARSRYYSHPAINDDNKALETINKALVLEQVLEAETLCSLLARKAHILFVLKDFYQADQFTWKAWELAKENNLEAAKPSLLLLMARLARDLGDWESSRSYYRILGHSIDLQKSPRWESVLKGEIEQSLGAKKALADLIYVRESNSFIEKEKGAIEMKSQHVLTDLALILLRNPGKTFTKQDLVQNVWKEEYKSLKHDNLLYVSIKRLRNLLEENVQSPKYILRSRDGYYFNPHFSFAETDHLREIQ